MNRPTIKDVANKAGVSVGLVSMVLNAKRDENGKFNCPVKEETAQKVLDAVRELDYKANRQAAGLRRGKMKTIAVIVPDISNKFFADIAGHLEEAAFKEGYTVIFCSSSESVERLSSLVDSLYSSNVDGMIIAPCANSGQIVRKTAEMGIKIVIMDRLLPGLDQIPSIALDNIRAGEMAARSFSRKGCTRIGVICYDTMISSLRDRIEGFKQEADRLGMEHCVTFLPYNSDTEVFKTTISTVVGSGADALFFPSNNAAVKGLAVANALGLSIPGDIAYLGFDDCDVFEVYSPRIPHISQSTKEFGEESFRMLIDLIEGREVKSKVLEPVLVND